MAIFDAMFEFSDAQVLTATAASTNVIDLQASDLELGAGEPVYLNVRVQVELDSAGDGASLTVALVGDVNATIDGSSVVVIQTAAIAEANCGAGAWLLRTALPVNFDDNQYIGLYYTVSGENFTTGSINAWLDHGPQSSYDTQVTTSNI